METFQSLFLVTFALLLGASHVDPNLFQDICVVDLSSVKVNGFPCKNPSTIRGVTEQMTFLCWFAQPGVLNNTIDLLVTVANVEKILCLNTLFVTMSYIDYSLIMEIVFVLAGELEVSFLTTSNMFISKLIKKGEIFLFPKGLVHFHKNIGRMLAAVITTFNSKNLGTQSIVSTLFVAMPTIPTDLLSKAFQIDTNEVEKIKLKLKPKN
ncbi:hypothetical protein ERO13_A05G351350v2 [Gossypium hirsutum]|nr:hypothetical protein ERO13_A05G351350v2 [Gossypium hirsutum]